jgi:hypothetical protein
MEVAPEASHLWPVAKLKAIRDTPGVVKPRVPGKPAIAAYATEANVKDMPQTIRDSAEEPKIQERDEKKMWKVG